MTRLALVSLLLATSSAVACSDDGGNGGAAGSGGGAAGSGGAAGAAGSGGGAAGSGGAAGGGGSAGPDPDFMSVAPCTAESSYVSSPTTIDFGLISAGFNYQPKCLKVPIGTQVRFMGMSASHDFTVHPMVPSASRGTTTGNPITATNTGNSATFTFPAKGFWAYYCTLHGADDGSRMAGVIWAD